MRKIIHLYQTGFRKPKILVMLEKATLKARTQAYLALGGEETPQAFLLPYHLYKMAEKRINKIIQSESLVQSSSNGRVSTCRLTHTLSICGGDRSPAMAMVCRPWYWQK